MNRANQFFGKFLKNFDKVSDNEKKRIFERLSDLCYSQNTIIENLEEGIISIDINGIIQGINKKACFLFSIPRNCENEPLSKYLSDSETGKIILELIKENDSDTKLLKDDDNKRILQINIFPLGESGRIIGTLIKAFDITQTYENSQKLKRAEQLASLTTLAAGVAHEIKNPLGSISIYIQLIEKIIKKNIDNSSQCFAELKDYCAIINLFVVVGGLEQTNVLELVAGFIEMISGGNVIFVIIIIVWLSAIASSIVDNIPFAATMVPVIKGLAAASGALDPAYLSVLAWSLSLGTDIGGSATPIGASANVVGTSVSAKHGHPISWGKYLKACVPATVLVLAICTVMIFVRYGAELGL